MPIFTISVMHAMGGMKDVKARRQATGTRPCEVTKEVPIRFKGVIGEHSDEWTTLLNGLFVLNSARADEHAIGRDMLAEELGSWESPMQRTANVPRSFAAFLIAHLDGDEFKAIPRPNRDEIAALKRRLEPLGPRVVPLP